MPPLEPGLGAGCLLPAQALLEAVGVALELEDVAAMGEAVQESRREVGVPEDLRPTGEVQVGGDQPRPPLVALGEDAEQQLGAGLGEGDEPDLVQDEEVQPEESALQFTQTQLGLGLRELIDETGGGGEANSLLLAAGGDTQGDGAVRFPGAGGPGEDHVLLPLGVVALGQLQDGLLVEGGDGREVEAVPALP